MITAEGRRPSSQRGLDDEIEGVRIDSCSNAREREPWFAPVIVSDNAFRAVRQAIQRNSVGSESTSFALLQPWIE